MKKTVRLLCVVLALLTLLPLPVFAGEKEDAINSLVKAVNNEEDIWDNVVFLELPYTDTTIKPHKTHFQIKDMVLTDNGDGSFAYTCTVSPCLTMGYNLSYDMALGDFTNAQKAFCTPVELSGTLLLSDDNKVFLLDGADPFSLYLSLRYMTPPEDDSTKDAALPHYLTYASLAYGRAVGMDYQEYADTVVLPEMEEFNETLSQGLMAVSNKNIQSNKKLQKADQVIKKIIKWAAILIVAGLVILPFVVSPIITISEKIQNKRNDVIDPLLKREKNLWENAYNAQVIYNNIRMWDKQNDMDSLIKLYPPMNACREDVNLLIRYLTAAGKDAKKDRLLKKAFGKNSYDTLKPLKEAKQLSDVSGLVETAENAFRNAKNKEFQKCADHFDLEKFMAAVELISKKEKAILKETERRKLEEQVKKEKEQDFAQRREALQKRKNRFNTEASMLRTFWEARALFLNSADRVLPQGRECLQDINRVLLERDKERADSLEEKINRFVSRVDASKIKDFSMMKEDAEYFVQFVQKAAKNPTYAPLWKKAMDRQRLSVLNHGDVLYTALVFADTKNKEERDFPQYAGFDLAAQRLTEDHAALVWTEKAIKQKDEDAGRNPLLSALFERNGDLNLLKTIRSALEPESAATINEWNWDLKRIHHAGNKYDPAELSIIGWNITAALRSLTMDATEELLSDYESAVEEARVLYNSTVADIRKLLPEYNKLEVEQKGKNIDNPALQKLRLELSTLQGVVADGIWGILIEHRHPVHAMVYLLSSSVEHHDRFIYQGIIMGLLPYLMKYRNELKPHFDALLTKRREMIANDNSSSFFEVRVPYGVTGEAYAKVLRFVLESANPSLPYCDLNRFLRVAQREVPNCMELLWACPLRLIDPANRTTLGFYKFNPYTHLRYTVFTPPKGVGQVLERYHQVEDMTTPLASGLQLLLFCDPYSIVPTLFHENEHFRGDKNEASVFLKTQNFSVEFYKKYRDANPQNDGVFATMTETLGIPAASEKAEELNALIKQYYGEEVPKEQAQKKADSEIAGLNAQYQIMNMMEKWCPEVKIPLLGKAPNEADEKDYDRETGEKIHEITVRYATTPKSITKDEFEAIMNGVV